jgi:disulfide bond formation protein DsbB
MPSSRTINLILFLGCFFLILAALYMEHAMGLEPCLLCIMQRIMVIVTGLVAIIAAVHNPGITGIRVYGVITIVAACLGGGVSGRQLWLQSLPEDQVPACGASLDYMLEGFPLTEVLSLGLAGDGTCAEVVWTLFGISIPGWALLGFIGLVAIGLYQVVRPKS